MIAHSVEVTDLFIVKDDSILCGKIDGPMLFAGCWHIEDRCNDARVGDIAYHSSTLQVG